MDLIGSIHYIENRLNGRKPGQGRGKPAQKNARSNTTDGKAVEEDSGRQTNEPDSRLGQKIDTTA